MHGGVFFRREKHGRMTLRAKSERKIERVFLNEMKELSREIERKTQEFQGGLMRAHASPPDA